MRLSSSIGILGVALCTTTAIGLSGGIPPVAHRRTPQGSPLDQLAWFTGCWTYTSPRVVIEEYWTRPAGGSMLGMSRTLRRNPTGDSTIAWEFIRLYARGIDLVYAAQPHNQPTTEFVSEKVSEGEVIFANPAHDFPQRIIYRRVRNDSLRARIEGTQGRTPGARPRASDFPYGRVSCDSARA